MPQLSFANLTICLTIAFSSRLLLGLVPRVRLPGDVVEIAFGIILGPAVLGWVEVDEPVKILALVGLAFTLFLAAVALCATSLGLVVPVTKQGGFEDRQLGQLVIAGATLGDFGAIIALSLLFSRDAATASTRFTLLVVVVSLIALVVWVIRAGGRRMRIEDVMARLADTTAQIRIRGVVLLIIALLVVRGLPALLYRGELGSRRDVVIAGLLQATSLPFIVTATMIGVEIGALTAGVAAAFVGAGLLSALIFPVIALTLAGRDEGVVRGAPTAGRELRPVEHVH
jgi:hypothetical protein